MPELRSLLEPRSIAVIGASANPAKSGGAFLKNIIDGGYEGRLYPVNPRGGEILGLPAYPTVRDVPGTVELAVIIVPRNAVRDAVAGCVERRVRAVAVITAGFGEAGSKGRALQDELVTLLRREDIAGVGPNTIGLVNHPHRLMATFVSMPAWQGGPVAMCAQTGIFAGAVIQEHMMGPYQRLGVNTVLDLGNRLTVDERDFLDYIEQDPAVRVIGLHVEGVPEVHRLLDGAQRVARTKPVVMLRPGRSAIGSAASLRHTGSLAVDDGALDRALRRHGIVRADDLEDFFAFLHAFSHLPLPRGRRVGIITTSGALGVMATDELVSVGLELASFTTETQRVIKTVLPDWQSIGNPADVWSALDVVPARTAIEQPLEAALSDPHIDMVLGTILVPPNADFPEVGSVFEGLRQRHPDKPIALVLHGGCREHWLAQLEGLGVPVFPTSRVALRALQHLAWYAARRRDAA